MKIPKRQTLSKVQREIQVNQKKFQEAQEQAKLNEEQQKQYQEQRQAFEIVAQRIRNTEHQVNQSIDFAINTLPWWNRNPQTVMEVARQYREMIEYEMSRIVSQSILKGIKDDTETQPSENSN